jgi:hypothetical protein
MLPSQNAAELGCARRPASSPAARHSKTTAHRSAPALTSSRKPLPNEGGGGWIVDYDEPRPTSLRLNSYSSFAWGTNSPSHPVCTRGSFENYPPASENAAMKRVPHTRQAARCTYSSVRRRRGRLVLFHMPVVFSNSVFCPASGVHTGSFSIILVGPPATQVVIWHRCKPCLSQRH